MAEFNLAGKISTSHTSQNILKKQSHLKDLITNVSTLLQIKMESSSRYLIYEMTILLNLVQCISVIDQLLCWWKPAELHYCQGVILAYTKRGSHTEVELSFWASWAGVGGRWCWEFTSLHRGCCCSGASFPNSSCCWGGNSSMGSQELPFWCPIQVDTYGLHSACPTLVTLVMWSLVFYFGQRA